MRITPFILPVLTLAAFILILIFFKPQITGFAIANPELNAEIKLVAELIPEDSLIRVYILSSQNNSEKIELINSTIKEYVEKNPQDNFKYISDRNDELDYSGYGYRGTYKIEISKGDLDLKRGSYTLKTEVLYKGRIVTESSQIINSR